MKVDSAHASAWHSYDLRAELLPRAQPRTRDAVPARPQPDQVPACAGRLHLRSHSAISTELEGKTLGGNLAWLSFAADGFDGSTHDDPMEAGGDSRARSPGKRRDQREPRRRDCERAHGRHSNADRGFRELHHGSLDESVSAT